MVVTRGSHGALLVSGEESREVTAPPTEALDTTGAGDAFNGALAAALAQGYELAAAVQRGVLAGSCWVAACGARSGMPTRAAGPRLGTESPARLMARYPAG